MTVAEIAGLPGVRPFVELGVGASYNSATTAQWDVDHWDTPSAQWVGDKPYWLDVTCYVHDIATFAGRERAVDQFDIGTATITVDNRDGLFDYPQSLADLLDDPTLLSIRPGRSIRVGVWIPRQSLPPESKDRRVLLWAGDIDGANPSYDAVEGSRMVIECIDAKGDAGRAQCAALATAVGAGETVAARINRVLTAAGWPTYRRDIDGSGVTVIATQLDGQAVDLLNLAADSAGGQVFGDLGANDGDPRVAYRQRDFPNYSNLEPPIGTIGDYGYPGVPAHYTYTVTLVDDGTGLVTTSSPTVTFTESPPGLLEPTAPPDLADLAWTETPVGSGLYVLAGGPVIPRIPADVCPSNWELTFNRADITTQATLARHTDTVPRIYPTPAQLAVTSNGYQAGLSMFGVEPYERTDLETTLTTDLDWIGNRVLTNRSWKYMPRVGAVTVTATASAPDTVDALANASPYSPARFRCQHKIDDRVVFNRVMMVVGVEHSITPTSWEARIALDDATPFLVGGELPGQWDVTGSNWDVATWANPI